MGNYTPGPWRAGYADERVSKACMIVRAEQIDGQPYVAICPQTLLGDMEANAVAIAALPDLLAACEAALYALETMLDEEPIVACDLRYAIRKAKGE